MVLFLLGIWGIYFFILILNHCSSVKVSYLSVTDVLRNFLWSVKTQWKIPVSDENNFQVLKFEYPSKLHSYRIKNVYKSMKTTENQLT